MLILVWEKHFKGYLNTDLNVGLYIIRPVHGTGTCKRGNETSVP